MSAAGIRKRPSAVEAPRRAIRALIAIGCLLPQLAGAADSVAIEHAAIVRQFIDAFNAHDATAMSTLLSDDVQWLSVREGETSIEVEGKPALVATMAAYFSECPTCRSEIAGLTASNERVSVVEVAHWEGTDGPKSQRSMAVYEFDGALIRRIYYFPEER
ncbi:MAG: nuclear transport factor 2 family protein [Pseudomonadota bacterium]